MFVIQSNDGCSNRIQNSDIKLKQLRAHTKDYFFSPLSREGIAVTWELSLERQVLMGAIKKHPSTALHQCLYLYHHPLTGFVQLHHEAATQAESWPHGGVTTHTTMPSPAHASCQRSASLKPSNFSSKESKTSPNPTSPCSLRISLSLSNTAAENEGY